MATNLRLDDQETALLRELAAKEHRSQAAILRSALHEYARNREQRAATLRAVMADTRQRYGDALNRLAE
jgi:predicted transcriptional regulator